jgi:hypothetical protein
MFIMYFTPIVTPVTINKTKYSFIELLSARARYPRPK